MDKKKRTKTVYVEDKGDTIYSMAGLYGRTPEEQEEYDKKNKNRINATAKERWAMLSAAITVYGPLLLIVVVAFGLAGLFMYLFLK
jgi:hypothetical protein